MLEILNGYPGETFIQEHAKAVIQHTDIQLSWAFWQNTQPGKLNNAVPGLQNCVGLINPNRLSKIKKAGIKLAYLNDKNSYAKALKRQVSVLKPNIIHFQFATLAVQHYRWVLDLGIPFTFSIRGSDIQTQTIISKEYIERLSKATDLSSGVHSVSDHLTNEFFKICGQNDKTTTIRTAIGEHWKNVLRNPIKGNLLAVGRLHWTKAYPDLLLACRLLKRDGFNIHLSIIGEGEQRSLLEYMIRDLDLSNEVKLVGKLDTSQIKNYLEKVDVFVLSSIAEGFPNVAGEAALAKVPIVATEDTFISEVFEPDNEVLMAKTGDPESISSKIQVLLEMDEEEKKKLTKEAQVRAITSFSSHQHGAEFNTFWHSVVAQYK